MSNIETIFKDRIVKEREKRATYAKYIFNSHLVMFLVIVFGAILINYSKWLKTATVFEMKAVIIVGILLLSYVLVMSEAKTYIKEADSVFLLPLEPYYNKILFKNVLITFVKQIIFVVACYFAVKPILEKALDNPKLLITNILILILILFTGVAIKYREASYGNSSFMSKLIFFLANFSTFHSLIFDTMLNYVAIILYIIIIVRIVKEKNQTLNWYTAAEYDKKREERYLKFVNMFVDVPIDSVKVARRKYFDILLPKLTENNFNVKNSYKYYYYRIFLRQEDTVFLALRLMSVAVLFMYSLNNIIVSGVIVVSYSYLTIIQLLPLYKKINNNIWSHILPVSEEIKEQSFKKLLTNVMLTTNFILTIIMVLIAYFLGNRSLITILVPAVGSFLVANIVALFFINKIKGK